MHEMSIAMEILDIIHLNAKKYGLKKVYKVIVKIGELTCIDADTLKFAFESIINESKYNKTELDFIFIKAMARCDNCNNKFCINFTNRLCPKCNQFSYNIIKGHKLTVETIEGE